VRGVGYRGDRHDAATMPAGAEARA
ncbi:MAG: hypothetical protein QOE92_1799, partial [Chloroflexota bacterium]|nr:hypothetical protein [Chloroflexota bacterium]